MDILVLSLVSAPFLIGMGLLIWGLRRMRQRRMIQAEPALDKAAKLYSGLGSLLVILFFPVVLLITGVPVALEAVIVITPGLLLIIIGEYAVRSALVSLRRAAAGAELLVFLGTFMLLFFLPLLAAWSIRLDALPVGPFIVAWCIVLVYFFWARFHLLRHWRRVGERRRVSDVDGI